MNLSSPAQVRELLQRLDIRPSRMLGQNFLIDGNTLRILLDLVDAQASDTILEVGPGLGVLTAPLLERAGRVIAVEKDPALYAFLQGHFADARNLDLVRGDILDVLSDRPLFAETEKIAANLPYGISGRFLVELSFANPAPRRVIVTVQDEVADRMAALPGTKAYGVLSVFVQSAFEVAVERTVSATCFYPRPQVKSAIVVLRRREEAPCADAELERFRALVRHAFSQRRKQLAVLLAKAPQPLQMSKEETAAHLAALGFDPTVRPESLPPPAWLALAARTIRNT